MAPLPLPAAVRVGALAFTFLALPGWLATGALRPDLPLADRLLSTLALSPALAGAVAVLAMVCGAPPPLAARIVAGVCGAAALAAAFRPASDPAGRDARSATSGYDFVPALAWAALTLFALAANPFLAPRSDGWFHAAVSEAIARRGVPVEDPSFAGLPLLYFWGMNAWAALWLAVAPGLAPWTPWIALDVASALAVMLAVASLARRLGATPGARAWAVGTAALGSAPFAWGWIAARAASGEVRGLAELRRIVSSGADGTLRELGRGLLHPSLAWFGDKFSVLTPFGLGLTLFVLFVIALHEAEVEPRGHRLAWLALVTGAALFTHTVAGFSALAVAWAWWAIGAGAALRGAFAWGTLARVAGAIGAGVVLALPYLVTVSRGKHGALAPGFTASSVGSLLEAGALFLPAAVIGFRSLSGSEPRVRALARVALLAALVIGAMGVLVKLPESNQSKFQNLLFVLLAAPAGLGLAATWRRLTGLQRPAFVLALALATVPTTLIAAAGLAAEHGQSDDSWHDPAAPVRAAWEWLRDRAPENTVIADEGGAREPMVFAARSALAPGASIERNWGGPPESLAARRLATRELSAHGEVSASTDSLVRALARPVVVVERRADVARDHRPPKTGALEEALAAGPRHPMTYRLVRDAGPLVFWLAEPAR